MIVCSWADALMGGGIQDVVGGTSHTGTGGEVEEGWWLASAPVCGILEGKSDGANALVEGGIPDVIGGTCHTGFCHCVNVGWRSTSTSSSGCGDHSSWATNASRSCGGSTSRTDTVEGDCIVEHAGGAAGEVEESLVGE